MAEVDQNLSEPDAEQPTENSDHEQREGHVEEPVAGSGEKKWQGWPGESVFRMLVPTQKTNQQMQIPVSYADAVIGTAGASISYIRRISGATVTIEETRCVPGEMSVEIGGTASQVQTAQQLIQNFMAEAAPSQPQGGTDQAFNSYPAAPPASAHASVYIHLHHLTQDMPEAMAQCLAQTIAGRYYRNVV